MLRETTDYWRGWVRTLSVPLEWQEAVIRAAITLKLCAYEETGALIRTSVLMAARCCPTLTEPEFDALARLGAVVGLAFQVQDDILDVEGDVAVLGKTPGSDRARGMPTYPAIAGMEAARTRVRTLHEEATGLLRQHGWQHSPLAALADWLLTRDR